MLFSYQHLVLYFLTTLIVTVIGQRTCTDYSPDPSDCKKFIRCFNNIRIKFKCPSGTAWEDSLKTCIWEEYVEGCGEGSQAASRNINVDESELIIYEADLHALDNITVSKTIDEARALGPIVTPKQYQCSYCAVGTCNVAVGTIQCICGSYQCPPTGSNQPPNLCDQQPCLNGGQCISNGPGFICRCPATYTGNRCEAPAVNPCQPNPCLNGGTCISQGTSFMCQCPSTYTGRCCENPAITPCQPNPCLNGGTCISQGISFLCQCPSMFYGRCCEMRITTTTRANPCAQSPCRNGGQCIVSGSSYLCQCPTGYYGMQCEIRNYCMPNPCANNGFCEQNPTGYICRCTYPFTGTNCQQMITTTTTTRRTTTATVAMPAPCGPTCSCVVIPCPTYVVVNPCMPNPCNNNGACGVQNYGAQCYCMSSYTGYYCQYRRSARSLLSTACNKTCLNGGKCYIEDKLGSQPRCSCPNEYYGPKCEFRNRPKSCSPKNPCMNKAKCITTKSGSQCVCNKGTSGVLCEKIQRSNNRQYCPLNCQAGGTCVYVRSKAKCRCPKGRTGRLCESRSGKFLSNDEDEINMLE